MVISVHDLLDGDVRVDVMLKVDMNEDVDDVVNDVF